MVRTIIVLTLLCCTANAAGMRIRAIHMERDGEHTQWGTCVCIADKLVATAAHVVDKGDVEVEVDGKWVKASTIIRGGHDDVALVRVEAKMEAVEMIELPRFTVSGSAESKPVKDEDALFQRGTVIYRAAQGHSGAPVMAGQACIGIIVTIGSEPYAGVAGFVGTNAIRALMKLAKVNE